MLDTNARKYIQPGIEKIANLFLKWKFSANQVTVLGFIIGLTGGLCSFFAAYFQLYFFAIAGIALLWISGFVDAVDGTMARLTKTTSPWGTLMDIVFDRVVEMSIIISLALNYQNSRIYFLFLLCAILFSMCVFLTVGALTKNNAKKSFRYQAGLMERCEGFICFSLMMLFPGALNIIIVLTTLLIAFTATQRMIEAKKLMD